MEKYKIRQRCDRILLDGEATRAALVREGIVWTWTTLVPGGRDPNQELEFLRDALFSR